MRVAETNFREMSKTRETAHGIELQVPMTQRVDPMGLEFRNILTLYGAMRIWAIRKADTLRAYFHTALFRYIDKGRRNLVSFVV